MTEPAIMNQTTRKPIRWDIFVIVLGFCAAHCEYATAHAQRDCSERLIGLSAPIGAFGAQNKQPLVAHAKLVCSERLIGLSAPIGAFGAQNEQPLVAHAKLVCSARYFGLSVPNNKISIHVIQPLVAQSDDDVSAKPGVTTKTGQSVEPESQPVNSDETMRSISAAVMILAVITIAGLTMLFVVILWGHRLRRTVQSKPAKQTVVDDLWYLRSRNKTPKDGDSESNTPDIES